MWPAQGKMKYISDYNAYVFRNNDTATTNLYGSQVLELAVRVWNNALWLRPITCRVNADFTVLVSGEKLSSIPRTEVSCSKQNTKHYTRSATCSSRSEMVNAHGMNMLRKIHSILQ